MHFLNATAVLTNPVNYAGTTIILTLFWRVLQDLYLYVCEYDIY